MRKEINNWKNSSKYKEFQAKLNIKRQELFELKNEIMDKKDSELSNEELKDLIKIIKALDKEPRSVDEFDYNYFSIIGTREDILHEYMSRMMNWFFYLGVNILDEEFELCAELRDVIAIEKKQMLYSLEEYKNILFIDDEFLDKVNAVDERFYDTINNRVVGKTEL